MIEFLMIEGADAVAPHHAVAGRLALCHRSDADDPNNDDAPLPAGIEAATRGHRTGGSGRGRRLDAVVFARVYLRISSRTTRQ